MNESPMSDIRKKIEKRVDEFVTDIEALIKEAALESVTNALGGREAPAARASRAPSNKGKPTGSKRTASEIDSLRAEITGFVQANPGRGAEQISNALSTTTKELALPMRKLVAEGRLSTKGQKRATKYFVGRGPGSSKPRDTRKR